MHDVDPELLKHWQAKADTGPPAPDGNSNAGGADRVPLTAHPAIRQQAMARFVRDETEAQVAAMQVKRTRPPWEMRLAGSWVEWVFKTYAQVRSFLVAHAGFVSAQAREYRLTACRGCTLPKDRGDGVLFCPPMLAKCDCPVWRAASLSWVTRLRDTECPIKRWDVWARLEAKGAEQAAAKRRSPGKMKSSCAG